MVIQLSAEPTSGIATRQSLLAELRTAAQSVFTFFIFAKIVIKRKDVRCLTIFNN